MIKTYGRRFGRTSRAEKDALERVLPRFQIRPDSRSDIKEIFGREAQLFLEIGFGNGSFLYEMALRTPDADFIGAEVYLTGVAKLLRRLIQHKQSTSSYPSNIRIFTEDCRILLERLIGYESLDGVYILFPDPWPKKRHLKRRLINPEFTQLLYPRLKDQGFVVVATDCEDYATQIEESFIKTGYIKSDIPVADINITKYAKKALSNKGTLFGFMFIKDQDHPVHG
jgi:tRNA (guanine-N7-)-methyltransferase